MGLGFCWVKVETILESFNRTRHPKQSWNGLLVDQGPPLGAAPTHPPASAADPSSYSATTCRQKVTQNFVKASFLLSPKVCTSTGKEMDDWTMNKCYHGDSLVHPKLPRWNKVTRMLVSSCRRFFDEGIVWMAVFLNKTSVVENLFRVSHFRIPYAPRLCFLYS